MGDDRIFTCTACEAEISADAESTSKVFKFHVKSEHKGELQQLEGTRDRSYRAFLSDQDMEKIRNDDVPI